jgi:hypothetical protein
MVRLGFSFGLGLAAMLTALAGAAFVLVGLFVLLEPTAGPGGAALICGAILFICSGTMAWLIRAHHHE